MNISTFNSRDPFLILFWIENFLFAGEERLTLDLMAKEFEMDKKTFRKIVLDQKVSPRTEEKLIQKMEETGVFEFVKMKFFPPNFFSNFDPDNVSESEKNVLVFFSDGECLIHFYWNLITLIVNDQSY